MSTVLSSGEVVSVCIGQCGTQVGLEFYNSLLKDTSELLKRKSNEVHKKVPDLSHLDQTPLHSFFRTSETGKQSSVTARSVLVDMEPKVIQQSTQFAAQTGLWSYDTANCYTKQSGSANNWAYGYNTHAASVKDPVLDIIQSEVEKCDSFGGFLVMMSLAGGTGSGTFLTEELRDVYPETFIVNQPVWPFQDGEVIVQNYNSILSMSHLAQVSDALMVIENDELRLICQRLLNIKKVSFTNMNKVIANSLVNSLLPANRWETSSSYSSMSSTRKFSWFSDPISHLCSHPGYKLLNIKTIPQIPAESRPFSTYVWSAILKRLYQMLLTDAKTDDGINWNVRPEDSKPGFYQRHIMRCLANLLILRGDELDKVDTTTFNNPSVYAPWTLDSLLTCSSANPFNKNEKSATLVSNSQSIVYPLEKIVNKAWEMYNAKAFLHQYEQHQLTQDDFDESFVMVEQILHNYKSL